MAESKQKFSKKSFHFSTEVDIVVLNCSSSSNSSLDSVSDLHVCGTDCVNIVISEILNPAYGLYVWPSAPVLAQFVWWNRSLVHGKNMLELGAGTALPSIVAAKCKAHVIVSDGELFLQGFESSKRNLEHNNVPAENFEMAKITWGIFSPSLLSIESVDIILGSDVFYEPDDFEDIVTTVSYLMQKNPSVEFWCTYQERNSDWNIEHLLEEWNIKCEEIPLDSFGASSSAFTSWDIPSDQKIHLFVFKRSDDLQVHLGHRQNYYESN